MIEQAKATYQSLKKNKYNKKAREEMNQDAGPLSKSLNPNTS